MHLSPLSSFNSTLVDAQTYLHAYQAYPIIILDVSAFGMCEGMCFLEEGGLLQFA